MYSSHCWCRFLMQVSRCSMARLYRTEIFINQRKESWWVRDKEGFSKYWETKFAYLLHCTDSYKGNFDFSKPKLSNTVESLKLHMEWLKKNPLFEKCPCTFQDMQMNAALPGAMTPFSLYYSIHDSINMF